MKSFVAALLLLTMSKGLIPSIQSQGRRIKTLTIPNMNNKIQTPEELEREAQRLREEVKALENELYSETKAKMQTEIASFFEAADKNKDGQVTLEELQAALKDKLVATSTSPRSKRRAEELVASHQRVQALLKELDVNGDGALQLEEMVDISQMRNRLERRIKMEQKEAAESQASQESSALVAKTEERLQIFEGIANRTTPDVRLLALACYLLPALDALPFAGIPPGTGTNPEITAAVQALASAAIAFRALPFSGILAILALNFVAANGSAARLTRFSARHAIFLDIAAVILLPLGTLVAPNNPLPGTALEVAILISAIAALFGQMADFMPLTGTYAKRFVDNLDNSVKSFLETATAAEANLLLFNEEDADENNNKKND